MKTRIVKVIGGDIEIKYHNPVFKEVKVEGLVDQFDIVQKKVNGEWMTNDDGEPLMVKQFRETILEKRTVTLCQTPIVTGNSIITCIGVSVMNPDDEAGELGKVISEGRAIKSPIKGVTISSEKKLPKPLAEEQMIWASKHVERHLNDYVNNIRETLK